MRSEEYRAMFELEDHLWWYRGMRAVTSSILDPYLPEGPDLRVLDVGCGTGYSLKWLREKLGNCAAFGVDISPHASVFWNEHGLDTAAIGSAHQIPLSSNSFDLVTCFDVIYQLPGCNAETAVSEMYRVLKPGGLLFIREPAYDWMRGAHDVAVGTDHRYTLTKLKRLLTAQDFALKRATYANSLLFGAAVPHRLVSKWRGSAESDVKPVAEWLNTALGAALKIEARLIGRVSFPFGLSVTALAEKKVS